jgi:hypothetical protein
VEKKGHFAYFRIYLDSNLLLFHFKKKASNLTLSLKLSNMKKENKAFCQHHDGQNIKEMPAITQFNLIS